MESVHGMTELQNSKAATPHYQGYFFSILAQNMNAYLSLLGPDLESQKQYLGDQLGRIVTEKEGQLQIANTAITFPPGPRQRGGPDLAIPCPLAGREWTKPQILLVDPG